MARKEGCESKERSEGKKRGYILHCATQCSKAANKPLLRRESIASMFCVNTSRSLQSAPGGLIMLPASGFLWSLSHEQKQTSNTILRYRGPIVKLTRTFRDSISV